MLVAVDLVAKAAGQGLPFAAAHQIAKAPQGVRRSAVDEDECGGAACGKGGESRVVCGTAVGGLQGRAGAPVVETGFAGKLAFDCPHQGLGARQRGHFHGCVAGLVAQPFARLFLRKVDDAVGLQPQRDDAAPDPVAEAARGRIAVAKAGEVDAAVGQQRIGLDLCDAFGQRVGAHEDGGAIRGLEREQRGVLADLGLLRCIRAAPHRRQIPAAQHFDVVHQWRGRTVAPAGGTGECSGQGQVRTARGVGAGSGNGEANPCGRDRVSHRSSLGPDSACRRSLLRREASLDRESFHSKTFQPRAVVEPKICGFCGNWLVGSQVGVIFLNQLA